MKKNPMEAMGVWAEELFRRGKIDPHFLHNVLSVTQNQSIYDEEQCKKIAKQWFERLKNKEDDKVMVRMMARQFESITVNTHKENRTMKVKQLLQEYKELGNSKQHKENADYASTFLDIMNGSVLSESVSLIGLDDLAKAKLGSVNWKPGDGSFQDLVTKNVEALKLGPVQSKKYFEFIAVYKRALSDRDEKRIQYAKDGLAKLGHKE